MLHSHKKAAWFHGFVFLISLSSSMVTAEKETRLFEASIMELHQSIKEGEITSVDLVEFYLARINEYDRNNARLNSIITINPLALERARHLDQERQEKGMRGVLHGIPIVVKDNINTQGLATTGGSVAFAGFKPSKDAFQIAKLKQAGAIILAKTNLDELARGTVGYSSLGGQTKNPYDLTLNPGGSSTGTAVAVTANFAAAGLGTDTLGSLRVPASFNNLVSLRPTKGLSSIDGIIPISHSNDVAGPMARSVEDVAILMDHTIGYDPQDSATELLRDYQSAGFQKSLGSVDLSALRVGKLNNYFHGSRYSKVNKVIDNSLEQLVREGVTFIDIDTALFDQVIPQLIEHNPPFEYKAAMDTYLQRSGGSGLEGVADLVDKGLYHEFMDAVIPLKGFASLSHNEQQAAAKKQWRDMLKNIVEQVMEDHDLDAMIYPTVKSLPDKLGSPYQSGSNAMLSSMSGSPALTLPIGLTPEGLPIGLELLGPALIDEKLVAIAYAIEQELGSRVPPPTTPPLVNGKAPAPVKFEVALEAVADIELAFDTTQNTLAYQVRYTSDEDIYAICLHYAKEGPVIYCLSGRDGTPIEGVLSLNKKHRDLLRQGALVLRLYSSNSPLGQLVSKINWPD